MTGFLHAFCALAVFCGAALRLAPEGSVRRVMRVTVTAVLALSLLAGLGGLQDAAMQDSLARLHESEQRFRSDAEAAVQRMDRLVIEEELRSYIRNKAEQRGVVLSGIVLEMRWHTDGFWLPHGITLSGTGERAVIGELLGELEAELGVSRERMRWVDDEGLEKPTETA